MSEGDNSELNVPAVSIKDGEPILAGTALPVAAVVHACHEQTIDAGLADLAVPGLDRNSARADPHLLRRAALRGRRRHVSRLPPAAQKP